MNRRPKPRSDVRCRRNMRLSKGREPYGNGAPIVVGVRESRTHGKGGQVDRNKREEVGVMPYAESQRLPGTGEPCTSKVVSTVRRGADGKGNATGRPIGPKNTRTSRLPRQPPTLLLTRPPAEMPAADTGESIGTCGCRLSPLLCGPRLNSLAEVETVLWTTNPRISGREEVGAMSWSQSHGDARLPQGRSGSCYRSAPSLSDSLRDRLGFSFFPATRSTTDPTASSRGALLLPMPEGRGIRRGEI
jgi:hypothetical protein